MTSQRLSNRVAVVTGSSQGLGRAISLEYSRQGANVVCADIRPDSPVVDVHTHDLITQQGGKAIYVKTNVTDPKQVEAVIAKAVQEFGRLDMYVHVKFHDGVN